MGTRYVGVAFEGAYGRPTTPIEFIDVISESVTGNPNIIYIETAGLGRTIRQAAAGAWSQTGSIETIAGPENTEFLLMATLGHGSLYDDGGGRYKHIFVPASTVPSLTIDIMPDIGGQGRRLTGCGISSLAFEAVAREVLSLSADVVGRKEELVAEGTPTFSSLMPFVFYQGQFSIDGGVVARCEAWRGTYENTIADDAFVLGSRFLPALILGPANFTGDMDMQFTDWQYYQKFMYQSGTEPSTELSSAALELDFVGAATGGAGDFSNYELKIEIPRVFVNTSDASFDRRERIVQSAEWTATYDTTLGYLCRFTVVNKRTCTFQTYEKTSGNFTIGT